MRIVGTARLGRRTKDLVKRLGRSDIAIVDHVDMDRVSAEALLETGVEAVVNASSSISGAYPNLGPLVLVRGGVRLIDAVGQDIFARLSDGDQIEIVGGDIVKDGEVVASGTPLSVDAVERAMEAAKEGLDQQLEQFARNTIEHMLKERALLTEGVSVPNVKTQIAGKDVLVVVRGYDYKEDLRALVPYIREVRPVLIGVDGGADALLELGFTPDLIVGDMDSVSDDALRSGAELVVHAYPDGRCPGRARVQALGLAAVEWATPGTSEDLALLLAYESGAELIVAVGTHTNLIEQLDKGRKGAASTFLVRLKVGSKLVDAKGVSRLYKASVGAGEMVALALAAIGVIAGLLLISPAARALVRLAILGVRAALGI
ncbi:putative cytokinetic ring protein SteA [Coriobacteriia bacterium Es71-Z0120]|uniref:putative cytokinetic ring protein SteA n=1 Tax=Parvivirga hydrogeniphila TaxID=2939460 RepID=UPI0022608C07|nr:putative cytokinetic ring protein SteA [Parvivirga hydrogeniphila]MCL4079131.1 putative cytokinetic ring protein SteA [Parvivirga hydrogeniphila]